MPNGEFVNSDGDSNEQRCEEMYKMYHAKFPDIQTLTSKEFLSSPSKYCSPNYLLVDVRSKAEQKVSMIPGSITMREFDARMALEADEKKDGVPGSNDDGSSSPPLTIVTYCTIGYRSGLLARKIRDKYGLNVLNLDGIVNYTHAVAAHQHSITNDAPSSTQGTMLQPDPSLIDPKTKRPTRRVHVFGAEWDVTHEEFEATYFSKPGMACGSIGIIVTSLLDFIQRILYATCTCCRKRSESNRLKDD